MNKAGIKLQLWLGYGLVTGLLLLIAALAIVSLAKQKHEFDQFVDGNHARAQMGNQLLHAIDARAIAARNLVLVTTEADRDKEKTAVLRAHAAVLASLQELEKLAIHPDASEGVRVQVQKIGSIEKQYGKVALTIVQLALDGDKDAATTMLVEQCRPLLAALAGAADEFDNAVKNESLQATRDADARYVTTRNSLILASVLTCLVSIAAGVLISRHTLKTLGSEPAVLKAAVARIADGDLRGQLEKDAFDTSSVLAAVDRMQYALISVVSSVRDNSLAVATAAAEISAGNNDLSQRTEQQASSLEETASSVEELATTLRQNAAHALRANTEAHAASDVASKGGQLVAEVADTMQSINTASQQIARITGVIDSIAFQTNILALNAAVEAARAGEQGRGFAVVAGEVRNLAQRSAAASKEIKALIDNSAERVRLGSELATKAGATMTEVVDSVRLVSGLIGEISDASQEQMLGIEHINRAITEIDDVTQQNAALVEQAAASASSLHQQADELVQVVEIFRITGNGATAGQAAPQVARSNVAALL